MLARAYRFLIADPAIQALDASVALSASAGTAMPTAGWNYPTEGDYDGSSRQSVGPNIVR